ncbi:MAG: SAF domain-containing protein [Beutenbergiaceae bacterium]
MVQRIRPWLWRYRWFVVAACLAGVLYLTVAQLRPPAPPTTPITVTAQSLPAGHVLTPEDIDVIEVAYPPPTTLPVPAAVDTRLAIGVPAGAPLLESMVVGPGLIDSAPPGWVVTAVLLTDASLTHLVRPGEYIDLYLPSADAGSRGAEASLIAAQVLVLAQSAPDSDSAWWGSATSNGGPVIIVAAPRGAAAAITGAAGFGAFHAVLSGD